MPKNGEYAQPAFAREMADRYCTSTISQFIMHGAVRDLVPLRTKGEVRYATLEEYLEKDLFAQRSAIIFYDRSRGLSLPKAGAMKEFMAFVKAYDTAASTKYSQALPTDAPSVLRLIERFIRTRVAEGKGVAVIVDYAEQIAPAGEGAFLSDADRSCLITLRRWARDPDFLRGDVTIVLVTEQLAELHRHIVANPYSEIVDVELPDEARRHAFIRHEIKGRRFSSIAGLKMEAAAKLTNGLSLTHIRQILAEPLRLGRKITTATLMRRKKELIEAECHGLLEFVEPEFDLDMVAGCKQAKTELRTAARLLKEGRLDVMPMGWLICGPVGTGKTFLATCFTGEIGIPCVKILNIRSQWQGVTEANLQKLLSIFKALGPVGVIIDEADAFFGRRDASGDSGTSSRVFSALSSFMSDTAHRGRILWFLLTCRPDLLPVDLKRQGRAEEHIALFGPATATERKEFYSVLKKKNGIETKASDDDIEDIFLDCGAPHLSGADLEAVMIRAKGVAAARGFQAVAAPDFQSAFENFLPPVYAEEVEYQTLLAVMECTSRRLIPEPYDKMPRESIAERLRQLRIIIEGG